MLAMHRYPASDFPLHHNGMDRDGQDHLLKPLTFLQWKVLQWLAKPWANVPGQENYYAFTIGDNGKIYTQAKLTVDAQRAFVEIAKRGWTRIDEYKNHWLNEAGKQAAKDIPQPTWNPPAPPALDDRDVQMLRELNRPNGWYTPLDCGGTNGSYHSGSLTKLARHGYAECTQRGEFASTKILSGASVVLPPSMFPRPRGSRCFRITQAGKDFLSKVDVAT